MKNDNSPPRLNAQILEEAAQWLVEFNAGDADPTLQQEFHTWLRASPEHVRAYLEIVPIWEAGTLMPPEEEGIRVADLIALGKTEDNIVPLGVSPGESASPQAQFVPAAPTAPVARWRRRFAVASFAALACIAVGSWAWLQSGRVPTYATEVGEQRSIALADG